MILTSWDGRSQSSQQHHSETTARFAIVRLCLVKGLFYPSGPGSKMLDLVETRIVLRLE